MSHPHQREVEIFESALQLSPELRQNYLEQTCAGNSDLLQRIQALLKANESQTDFLGSAAPVASFPLSEQPGDKIGRYKLLEQIGEGGCGVVYVAEQQEPVRRRVAFKIIKLGMDTKQVIARFEAERQALAMMDHPSIAKIFDAGATQAGRPYFVMELVRGVKITDYCRQNQVSARERLDLFMQVCRAIQHAHQKGVIHRDIKPSNILVTVNDGVPVPKVIDFGIAKATNGERLTDETVYTAFEQFIGTPAYMSPEQAAMTSLDIDTRSDIYSLGVLLYELLTGKTPFDQKELLAAGLDEMRRTIREKEPPKPSTRLTQELASKSEIRSLKSEIEKRIHLVRGDLDWIVMKCLEKDRGRRYETANGLATDILRHLRNEPVLARPSGRLYHLRKTIRRHRVGFTLVGSVILILVLAVATTTFSLIKERRARNRAVMAEQTARNAAAKSRQVTLFLEDMLLGEDPFLSSDDDTNVLQKILDRTAERIGNELTNQPEVEAELRLTLGKVYFDIRDTKSVDKSEAMCREALRINRNVWGNKHPAVMQSLRYLANVLSHEGRFQEAEQSYRESVGIARELYGERSPEFAFELGYLGRVLGREKRWAESESVLRRVIALQEGILPKDDLKLADNLRGLASALQHEGNLADSHRAYEEALRITVLSKGSNDLAVALILDGEAGTFSAEHRISEAESLLRKSLLVRRSSLRITHPDVIRSVASLGRNLEVQGKLAEAEAVFREALDAHSLAFASEAADGQLSLALSLAGCLQAEGKTSDLETLCREQVTSPRTGLETEDFKLADLLSLLAKTLCSDGKYTEAESPARECLALRVKHKPGDWTAYEARFSLGDVLLHEKRYTEAEPLLVSGYEGMEHRETSIPLGGRDSIRQVLLKLMRLYEETARPELFARYRDRLSVFWRREADALVTEAEGGDLAALNDLAWLFATCTSPEVRDGKRAIAYAERAALASGRSNGVFLDTLAAAYAEDGQFVKAVSVQREAIALLSDTNEVNDFTARLNLYLTNTPYRQP